MHCVTADSPLQVVSTSIEDCDTSTSLSAIRVKCNAIKTGFQVIARLHNASQVHKLYVNHTIGQNEVTVTVERNGEYQISVFAISEGIGIVESTVQFMDLVVVNGGTSTDATEGR